jgi:hypothetical protein
LRSPKYLISNGGDNYEGTIFMLGDGEVIGIVVLIAVTIVVSMAFVFWIQGNPAMDTGIDNSCYSAQRELYW